MKELYSGQAERIFIKGMFKRLISDREKRIMIKI